MSGLVWGNILERSGWSKLHGMRLQKGPQCSVRDLCEDMALLSCHLASSLQHGVMSVSPLRYRFDWAGSPPRDFPGTERTFINPFKEPKPSAGSPPSRLNTEPFSWIPFEIGEKIITHTILDSYSIHVFADTAIKQWEIVASIIDYILSDRAGPCKRERYPLLKDKQPVLSKNGRPISQRRWRTEGYDNRGSILM